MLVFEILTSSFPWFMLLVMAILLIVAACLLGSKNNRVLKLTRLNGEWESAAERRLRDKKDMDGHYEDMKRDRDRHSMANGALKQAHKKEVKDLKEELAELTKTKEKYERMADGVAKALSEEEYWEKDNDDNS